MPDVSTRRLGDVTGKVLCNEPGFTHIKFDNHVDEDDEWDVSSSNEHNERDGLLPSSTSRTPTRERQYPNDDPEPSISDIKAAARRQARLDAAFGETSDSFDKWLMNTMQPKDGVNSYKEQNDLFHRIAIVVVISAIVIFLIAVRKPSEFRHDPKVTTYYEQHQHTLRRDFVGLFVAIPVILLFVRIVVYFAYDELSDVFQGNEDAKKGTAPKPKTVFTF